MLSNMKKKTNIAFSKEHEKSCQMSLFPILPFTWRQSLHEINLCWPCANCFEARPLILDPNEISGCEKPGELVLTRVLTIHLILMRISPQCWRSHCSVFCICLLIIGNSKKQISKLTPVLTLTLLCDLNSKAAASQPARPRVDELDWKYTNIQND